MDELIEYINSNFDKYHIHIRYSTFGEYINTINKADIKWPLYEGDYFPYTDKSNAYWTGYYTSRPLKKGLSREAYNVLRSAELLYSEMLIHNKSLSNTDIFDEIMILRKAQALSLHHDAITGTEKQRVSNDYISFFH